ncbi:MAG TPA: hypothetical protein VKB04_01770 [Anaerolineales bacterium]|nr:hypothetical protein [Anaerolineales bacterium]
MQKIVGLLTLHVVCIYFLWLLWKDKKEAEKRGGSLTKMGYITKTKSPRLFRFSIWVDFLVLLFLYILLAIYSLGLAFQ